MLSSETSSPGDGCALRKEKGRSLSTPAHRFENGLAGEFDPTKHPFVKEPVPVAPATGVIVVSFIATLDGVEVSFLDICDGHHFGARFNRSKTTVGRRSIPRAEAQRVSSPERGASATIGTPPEAFEC